MKLEMRERKKKRNNIAIKGWEVPKKNSLEKAMEELLQRELCAEETVTEVFWTRRETNMVTTKLRN